MIASKSMVFDPDNRKSFKKRVLGDGIIDGGDESRDDHWKKLLRKHGNGGGDDDDDDHHHHRAATKLQKFYRSHRTRRNIADCAIVVEELWWKELDNEALTRSSLSFFNSEKAETAVSRWGRAMIRAAKLGKGLCKDEKAQKLALRHWLEAIDPRHRYGYNLHFYYAVWFASESTQPFFYWLDVGDGKEVNHEKCPRNDLQHQCIKYLGPKEREAYEVVVESGKLVYRQTRVCVNTAEGSKWIFVLSTWRKLYVGEKKKGVFQHSSFLSGGATIASGRIVAFDGMLEAIWAFSGHYRPTEENFAEFCSYLEDHQVDLSNVKKYPIDDDIPPKASGRNKETKLDLSGNRADDEAIGCNAGHEKNTSTAALTNDFDSKKQEGEEDQQQQQQQKLENCMRNHDVEEEEEEEEEDALLFETENNKPPAEAARSNLSGRKWTTGAGPRISCVRDYPTQLQFHALEQLNLSPRLHPNCLIHSYGNGPAPAPAPVPSPRPNPDIHLSPTLSCLGMRRLPSPSPTSASLHL